MWPEALGGVSGRRSRRGVGERVSWTVIWLSGPPGARDGDKADAWRNGGRVEGLMDLATWIDGDRLEFIKMSGREDDVGDLPSTGGTTLGQMAVKRPDRKGGIGSPGMSVRDHG